MTKQDYENLVLKLAEVGIETAQMKGELETLKNENKFLRELLSEQFRQPVVSGSCHHVWIEDKSMTTLQKKCSLCGAIDYSGNLR